MTNSNAWQGQPGVWNTNSYLSSGIPYLTGSTLLSSSFSINNGEIKVVFPFVTRAFTVINRSAADIRLHFNSLVSGNVIGGRHYATLVDDKDSITFNMKCREFYVSLATSSADGSFELVAELTNIPSKDMFPLTGSGLTV